MDAHVPCRRTEYKCIRDSEKGAFGELRLLAQGPVKISVKRDSLGFPTLFSYLVYGCFGRDIVLRSFERPGGVCRQVATAAAKFRLVCD